jgi:hypothetical protein
MSARDARANAVPRRRPISFTIFSKGYNSAYKNRTPRVR